jgi:hypothetical protein
MLAHISQTGGWLCGRRAPSPPSSPQVGLDAAKPHVGSLDGSAIYTGRSALNWRISNHPVNSPGSRLALGLSLR